MLMMWKHQVPTSLYMFCVSVVTRLNHTTPGNQSADLRYSEMSTIQGVKRENSAVLVEP